MSAETAKRLPRPLVGFMVSPAGRTRSCLTKRRWSCWSATSWT